MAAAHPETIFAANLVQYIMRSNGNEWAPDPQLDGVSPYFTPLVQTAIDSFLSYKRTRILGEFNGLFANLDSDMTEEQFIRAISSIRRQQLQNGFHTDSFFSFCCWVSQFAVLAVARGFRDAPNRAFTLIIQEVQEARQLGRLVNYF